MTKREKPISLHPSCGTCRKTSEPVFNHRFLSYVPTFLIAIIPKCHFCVLAYSSVITLCSGKAIVNHSPQWSSFISIFLCVIVLLAIAMNRRGQRTFYAFAFASVGLGFISYSELISGQLLPYYIGAAILLFSAWLNGSLFYFLRKARDIFPINKSLKLKNM